MRYRNIGKRFWNKYVDIDKADILLVHACLEHDGRDVKHRAVSSSAETSPVPIHRPPTPVIVLSHWPHVAEQVRQQVAEHVASVKGLGHKLPNLLLNMCRV